MATIKNVAEIAGVSASTVSMVIRGSTVPSESVRGKVWAAVKELNYVPNQAARNLRKGKNQARDAYGKVIAFIACRSMVGRFFSEYSLAGTQLAVLARETSSRRLHLLLNLFEAEQEITREYEVCRPVMDGVAQGVIAHLHSLEPVLAIGSRVPVVLYNSRFDPDCPLPTVNVDEAQGMRMIVRHLAEQGCRRFGYLHIESPQWQLPLRRQATLDAVRELGLVMDDAFERAWTISPETHVDVMEQVLEFVAMRTKKHGLDALVCPGDVYAFDLKRMLGERGVRIPRDLAITGFDDIHDSGGAHAFDLTTVRIPWVPMIRSAVDILARSMEGEDMPVAEVRLQPELVVRGSSMFGH